MVRRANGGAAIPQSDTIQRKGDGANASAAKPAEVARAGTASAAAPLPHLEKIQRSFGSHDVSNVRAEVGGKAADASQALGAQAYATGNTVGFASSPDLHTSAHEAAHVVQQRGGVQLKGGIDGGANDPYERHADQVADEVVAGRSAEGLLSQSAGSAPEGATVQRKPAEATTPTRQTNAAGGVANGGGPASASEGRPELLDWAGKTRLHDVKTVTTTVVGESHGDKVVTVSEYAFAMQGDRETSSDAVFAVRRTMSFDVKSFGGRDDATITITSRAHLNVDQIPNDITSLVSTPARLVSDDGLIEVLGSSLERHVPACGWHSRAVREIGRRAGRRQSIAGVSDPCRRTHRCARGTL